MLRSMNCRGSATFHVCDGCPDLIGSEQIMEPQRMLAITMRLMLQNGGSLLASALRFGVLVST
jgi:hypothetical protein